MPPSITAAASSANPSPARTQISGTESPQGSRRRRGLSPSRFISSARQALTLPTWTKVPTPKSPARAPQTAKAAAKGR